MHSGSKSLAPAALSTEMSEDGAAINGAAINGAAINGAAINGAAINGAAKGGAAVNVEMGGANSEQASGAQPGR